MADDEGASPREIVVEACRRDQPHLLEEVMEQHLEGKSEDEIATFFNGVADSMGNHCLHVCAMYGSYDVMDNLFDIKGFECDPLTRVDRDTPLHVAVRYVNELDDQNEELGLAMIEMMCDAGCDPRVKNKHGLKPVDLLLPKHNAIKSILQRTEYIFQEGMNKAEDEGNESDGPSDSDDEVENGQR